MNDYQYATIRAHTDEELVARLRNNWDLYHADRKIAARARAAAETLKWIRALEEEMARRGIPLPLP